MRKPGLNGHARRLFTVWLLTAAVVPALAQPACQLRIRWADEPPYSMQLPDGSPGGLQVELARAVFKRMGCELRWTRLPWARALRELEDGQLDVLMGTLRLPERETYAWFSRPNRASFSRLFIRRSEVGRWSGGSLAQLADRGMRLGMQPGVNHGPEFDELMRNSGFRRNVAVNPSRQALWRMLAIGRIDALIADEHTALLELREIGLAEQVGPANVNLVPLQVSDAFSKRTVSPELVQRYDETVEQMRRDGSLKALLAAFEPRR